MTSCQDLKKKMKGGKCDSFDCPKVSYKSGSSLDQANEQLSEEQSTNVNNTSKMNGINTPKTGGFKNKSNNYYYS